MSVRSGILYTHRTLVSFVQQLLNPILVVVLYFRVATAFGKPLGQADVVLAMLSGWLVATIFPPVGAYRSHRSEPIGAQLPRILVGWGFVVAALSLIGFATGTMEVFARGMLLTWVIATPAVLFAVHVILVIALRQFRARGRNTRPAVIAGAGDAAGQVADRIRSAPDWGIRVMGFFDDDAGADREAELEAPLLGRLDELTAYVKANEIAHVYLALPLRAAERALALLQELKDTTASVYLVPETDALRTFNFSVQDMNGVRVYALCETPFADEVRLLTKRISDVVIASVCLVLASPLLLLACLGTRLTSRGPVFFKQRRFGLNGQAFTVYKIRTMRVTAGDDLRQATRDDPRCTRFGAFLRRTSLDELPQLVNVLQGTMSMVGPRPHAVAHNEQYRKLIDGYMVRHKVKPGLTGWAQVHGLRGETDTVDKMRRRVEYDLHYMENWSLGLDLEILLKTPLALLRGTDAY